VRLTATWRWFAGLASRPVPVRRRAAVVTGDRYGPGTAVAVICGEPPSDDGDTVLVVVDDTAPLGIAMPEHGASTSELNSDGYVLLGTDLRSGVIVRGVKRHGVGYVRPGTPVHLVARQAVALADAAVRHAPHTLRDEFGPVEPRLHDEDVEHVADTAAHRTNRDRAPEETA